MADEMNSREPVPQQTSPGFLRRLWFIVKVVEIRLRFVLVLAISALLIGYWDVLRHYYDRYTRPPSAASAKARSDIEFFCPMHTFIVRDVKGKCPICGMDLAQRKRGEKTELPEGAVSRVQVSPLQIAEAGVVTEQVHYRLLARHIRAVGTVEVNERTQAEIAARFPGRVEQLLVNYVGAEVKKGEALARFYSPKYQAAAQEYLQSISAGSGPTSAIAQAARRRLLLAGFAESQIDEMARIGQAEPYITYYSPISGTVLERDAVQGKYVEEGARLFSLADLSTVWVQVRILESDFASVRLNQPVEIRAVAVPGLLFVGHVSFVYPTVDVDSRSVRVRVEVRNPDRKLRPGMYVTAVLHSPVGGFEPLAPPDSTYLAEDPGATTASLASPPFPSGTPGVPSTEWETGYTCLMHPEHLQDAPGTCTLCDCGMMMTKWRREKVLAVPERAVIDTGLRQFVYVEQSAGVFDAHQVTLGEAAGEWYPVLAGLKPGMSVAAAGSFLLDAENRLNPSSDINNPQAEPSSKPSPGEPTVVVKGSYKPEMLHISPSTDGRIRIVFDRQEESACTAKVVFPSLGIERDLPPFQKTAIDLPTTATGTIPYSCGMDMIHGTLMIEEAGKPAERRGNPGEPSAGHEHAR